MRTISVILLATITTFLVVWFASQFVIGQLVVPVDCNFLSSDHGELCARAKELGLGRSNAMITAVGMVASVISTIALVVTIYYTSRATKAATDAVIAANRALDHQEMVSTIQLRPYMVPGETGAIYSLGRDGQIENWRFKIGWMNTGETPAQYICAITRLGIFDRPVDDSFRFPWEGEFKATLVCGPDRSISASSFNLSLAEMMAVQSGDKFLYLYGFIEYQGLEQGVRYRTEYASGITVGNPSGSDMWWETSNLSTHNGIDAGCMFEPVTEFATRPGPVKRRTQRTIDRS